MKETLKKLDSGHVEIRTLVEHEEVITVLPTILDRDIKSAEEAVTRRESELKTAKANLDNLIALKAKISKAK